MPEVDEPCNWEGGSGMTTPYHRIGRNAHRLPAGYFADAQNHLPAGPLASATPNLGGPSTSAAPENLERSEQSGAESGDASGESGAAVHSPDRAQQLHAAQIIFGKQS